MTDQLGRTIWIEKIPQRIVSILPGNTALLFALGLGDRVVGVTEFCDYPAEAREKEKVGWFLPPDIDKVKALAPDLVLAYRLHEEIIPALEEEALTVFALAAKNFNEVHQSTALVGKLTGREREASRLIAEMQQRIRAITHKTEGLPQAEKPRVFFLMYPDPLWTTGSSTTSHDVIEKAGGINIAQAHEGYGVIDLETVVEKDPEAIIAAMEQRSDKPFFWAGTSPELKGTKARKHRRVYRIDTRLLCPGPRIVEGLEWFAHFIHPEIFPAPDPRE